MIIHAQASAVEYRDTTDEGRAMIQMGRRRGATLGLGLDNSQGTNSACHPC